MYIKRNPNPLKKNVGDCVVRALSTVLGEDWDTVYLGIMAEGYAAKDIPTADYVWGNYLKKNGYYRSVIPNTCPNCYTVRDFCEDHPRGKYVLGTGAHAVAVVSGNYIDTWDSGDQVPVYYWKESDI